MIVTIPFCGRDLPLASSLLEWIDDLGGCRKHSCLLVADNKLTDSEVAPIRKAAKLCFKTVTFIRIPYSIKLRLTNDTPWPVGPNMMFYSTALYMAMTSKESWLWLEPDCVPLSEGWLEKIEDQYRAGQKPFLGPVIETQNKSFEPQYLNGTAVYPHDAAKYFHDKMVEFFNGKGNSFDLSCSPITVPNCFFSNLIQHGYTDNAGINHWGTHPNQPLVFKETNSPTDGENVVAPDVIHDGAVLFHPCKNSSLIDLLRKTREQVKVPA